MVDVPFQGEDMYVALVGQDEHGVWLTRRAQPYPTAMCAEIAAQLNQS